ncbi:MAG: zinc metallopeptidase [Saprospiraceae bacterium]|nr:zinc metallopeptidase [Saprospiraceae bacterium]
MSGYFLIVIVFSVIGMIISGKLKSTFTKYGKVGISSGMSGAEVAKAMLDHYGIHDVKIVPGRGALTDHYNPLTKTIALSEPVYASRSISAAAVAAHECGHAVQHATAYKMLAFRSSLVPIVKFSSTIQQFLFLGLIFMGGTAIFSSNFFMGILAATFGATALFALVTLPVEFDASRRALAWLDDTGITRGAEYDGAKDALWWAAMTYVSNALASLAMFLFFLLRFMNND